MNVNKAIVIGRLTRDPEVRTTPAGRTLTKFSVATSNKWKGQDGQMNEKTEFHNVIAWGKRGEVIGQYMQKGQEIYVEGRLETQSWDDKDSGKKMYRTEINLENFEFGAKAGGGSSQNNSNNAPQNQNVNATTPQNNAVVEEEIPTINLDEEQDEVKIEDVPF
ncbi:MAG: single-stranded DNA-binding protein [Candidatus Moranbacteria bacterium]|nr:single-stranded DNA-binding protein [Candidatus Moranbacteria bacterium]